jgi:LmbE family N-acetylglucosaminyl deacetylase
MTGRRTVCLSMEIKLPQTHLEAILQIGGCVHHVPVEKFSMDESGFVITLAMNPYHSFVSSFARLMTAGKSLPLGDIPAHGRAGPGANAPVGLIFSPHPDDECIIGGLALRLLREAGMRIINVPVTLGSNRERQQPRLRELQNACAWFGFELEQTAPNGLERVNPDTRAGDSAHWAAAVKTIGDSLSRNQPRVILFPHELDWNSTHIGTHLLVMDALRTMSDGFGCVLVETEFWGQMPAPNLMVELGVDDVADLLAALSFHVGEVRRNPYHLRMPAWLQDNVRRGAELVGGQGEASPDFVFATLYRVRQWSNGGVKEIRTGKKILSTADDPVCLLQDPPGAPN